MVSALACHAHKVYVVPRLESRWALTNIEALPREVTPLHRNNSIQNTSCLSPFLLGSLLFLVFPPFLPVPAVAASQLLLSIRLLLVYLQLPDDPFVAVALLSL
jgi:hypothetical protein